MGCNFHHYNKIQMTDSPAIRATLRITAICGSSSGQGIHVAAKSRVSLEILSAEIKPAWRFSRGLKGPRDFVIESGALTENVDLLEGQSLKALVYNGKSWAKM